MPAETFAEVKRATVESLVDFERAMAPRMNRKVPVNTPASGGVSIRSGALSRSFRRVVAGHRLDNFSGTASMGTKYAATLELGDANRRPTAGNNLAIPLPGARTRAGVARLLKPGAIADEPKLAVTVVNPKSGKTSTRSVSISQGTTSPTFVKPSRRGNGRVMYLRQGRTAKPIPLFYLTPAVRIPAHLGFFDTFARLRPQIEHRFALAFARVVRNAGGAR
jgi:hypothetical protein